MIIFEKNDTMPTTKNQEMNENEWPWVLSKVGKKVLRPGGRELTMNLLNTLAISEKDDVVEFAPGMGFTAEQILKFNPKTYTGLEINEEAGENLKGIVQGDNTKILIGHAANAGEALPNESVDKIIAEAMLTMHADKRKSEIIKEAHRLLKKGGLYAIHELSLIPDDMPEEEKNKISKELAMHSNVNTRPLTRPEWIELVEREGFKVKQVWRRKVLMLEPVRMLKDEGPVNMLSTIFKIMRKPKARKKILEIRKVFRQKRNVMRAIGIVAEKI